MIKLLANPYALIGAGLLFLLAVGGAYFQGRSDGRNAVHAKAQRAMKKAMDALELRRKQVDRISGQLAIAQRDQATETREIFHESVKIVDRPVFKHVCGDADASRLFDRARANANTGLTGAPAEPATGTARDAP